MLSRTCFRRPVVPEIFLLRMALSIAFIYAVVGAWAWLISDRMMFLPPAPTYRDTADILKVPTSGGERIVNGRGDR